MKNKKKKSNQVNHYMYEDDFNGIDPAKGIKKEKRRASRHNQKKNLKNMKDPGAWEELEDMYDDFE